MGKYRPTIRGSLRLAHATHFAMLRETLGFLHFLLKRTTTSIRIFQIKLFFVKLQSYDIKMLDLE